MAGNFASASSQYINFDAHAVGLETAQGSISLWFKISSSGLINTLISGGDASDNNTYTPLYVGGNITGSYADESLNWVVYDNGATTISAFVRNGQDYYNDGVWHNCIIVMDGSDNRIYMDGSKQSLTFAGGAVNTANALLTTGTFDSFRTSGVWVSNVMYNKLNGQLDDLRIYDSNKYISDSDAKTIYNNRGNDGIITGLKGRWLMDELSAGQTITTAHDISGNGCDGTGTNSPTYSSAPLRTKRSR